MDEIFAQVYPAQGQTSEIRNQKSEVGTQRRSPSNFVTV
jgi:hypothetical protein